MKLSKRVMTLSVLCLGMTSCFSNLYATETKGNYYDTMANYGFNAYKLYATTHGDPWFTPELGLRQEKRDSKTYIVISVNDKFMNITATRSNGTYDGIGNVVTDPKDSKYLICEVTKEGWYDVRVKAANGKIRTESIHVTMSDKATKLELSRRYRDNNCYLVIDADDDDDIKSVTVNDVSISFSSTGGVVEHRIYNSGTYRVAVTDKYDNRKTESIYINVDGTEPTLKLSKVEKNGRCYLRVSADSDEKITKLTINNVKKDFPENGGTEDYEITATGTYKVVVTDKSDITKTESIYIDVNEKNTTKPTVKVSQEYKAGWYIIISAKDNGSISSVKVNGTAVPFDAATGKAQYYVPVDGTYNIEVTDNDGNKTTTSTFAAGNANINSNMDTNTNSNANANSLSGNTTIVFKLNKKEWTINGVAQQKMNAAPKASNSRIYLPIRQIAYALGIEPENIQWNSSTRTVTIYDNNNVVKVKIGSKTMYVNDKAIAMDAAPTVSNQSVMLPLSQIRPAFSYKNVNLDWNNVTKQLTIKR